MANGSGVSSGYGGESSSSVTIDGSRLTGSTAAVYSFASSTVLIAHSQLDGEAAGSGLTCYSVCDESLNPLDEVCQPIPP